MKTSPSASRTRPRVQALDGVRALLALWVVLGHLCRLVGAPVPLIGNPAIAVDLFMVLSGFFIATTFDRLVQQQPWVTATRYFLIRRLMRIGPLYLVCLSLCWWFLEPLGAARVLAAQTFPVPLAQEAAYLQTPYDSPTWQWVLLHYSMLFGVVPSQATATPLPDWSLSLEFQFYLLFPVLALGLRRRPLLVCFVAAGLAFVSPGLLGDYFTPGRFAHFHQPAALVYKLNVFLLGVMAWRLFARVQAEGPGPGHVELLAVVMCLVPLGAQATLGGFGIFYLLARSQGAAAQWLSHPVMTGLGRISFTIYLVHQPVLWLVVAALIDQAWFLALPSMARYGVATLCMLPLVIVASQMLYVLIESPGIRLAHRWTRGGPVFKDGEAMLAPGPVAKATG